MNTPLENIRASAILMKNLPSTLSGDALLISREEARRIGYELEACAERMGQNVPEGMAIVPVMQRVTKAEDLIDSAFYFAGGGNGLVKLGRGEWMRNYAIGEHGGYAVVGPITMPDFKAMLAATKEKNDGL